MNINTSFEQSFMDKLRFDHKDNKNIAKAKKREEAENVEAKTNNLSAKNEEKLSEKAQELLKNLREKYGDYDFMVGNSDEEFESLSKTGSKEFSVIISSDELEKMANDEAYADEKMSMVEKAVEMCKRVCEENGYSTDSDKEGENGRINKISVSIDGDGNMKFFAEIEKLSAKQKERIEKNKEKKAEEQEKAEKAKKNNPYEKDKKNSVKRTSVEADSVEELIDKIKNIDWNSIGDSKSGDRFNFAI